MTFNPHTEGAGKLPALVEFDFDAGFLLRMIAQEPDEPLYRTIYKALYGDLPVDRRDHLLPPAAPPRERT